MRSFLKYLHNAIECPKKDNTINGTLRAQAKDHIAIFPLDKTHRQFISTQIAFLVKLQGLQVFEKIKRCDFIFLKVPPPPHQWFVDLP
jgi:hypothetical protein